jgi:thymidylate synthase (FAD)
MEDQVPAGNPALDSLRWKKFPVLDDGLVALVDCMGTDQSVVQAARVSYGSGTKKVSDDRNLIRYLMRHRHTTPFEMVEFKFFLRVPMDTWRQMVRHRTFSINEYSTRYSLAIDSAQKTDAEEWRLQSQVNNQGSSGQYLSLEDGEELSTLEDMAHNTCRMLYEKSLEKGVAREQARKNLPLCTYTELYWKGDLHNLFHFLSLRMDPHAQYEVRCFANAISEIVKELVPLCYEAFEDYRLNGLFLTGLDIQVLNQLLDAVECKVSKSKELLSLDLPNDWKKDRCRERDECITKLKRLGVLSDE